jgi:small multidrug resistance pump
MKNIGLLSGYLFLVLGVITGVAANGYLKTTEGFTKINPTIFCVISILVCMFCLSKAMTIIPVGFTYATYGALTITAVTLFGIIKYNLKNTNLPKLESNYLLEFSNKVNVKTGELGVYLNAFYRGLEFKIYESTETHPNRRATIEGSLHKYWNNGAHNFNDFGINEIQEVIADIENKF